MTNDDPNYGVEKWLHDLMKGVSGKILEAKNVEEL
jgi:hypothetical protein